VAVPDRPSGSRPPPEEPERQPAKPQPAKPQPTFGDFFWIGTGCAICILGAGGIGYALDDWLGTTPWFTFVGLGFGIVSAVLLVVAAVRRFL
jgi:hypothetical protein